MDGSPDPAATDAHPTDAGPETLDDHPLDAPGDAGPGPEGAFHQPPLPGTATQMPLQAFRHLFALMRQIDGP